MFNVCLVAGAVLRLPATINNGLVFNEHHFVGEYLQIKFPPQTLHISTYNLVIRD